MGYILLNCYRVIQKHPWHVYKNEVVATEKLYNISCLSTYVYKYLDKLNLAGRCHGMLIKEPLSDSASEKVLLMACRKFLAAFSADEEVVLL